VSRIICPRRPFLFILFFSVLMVAVLHPHCASAQSTSASVSGRVTDQSNAVIPNVEVEIKNTETGVVEITKTNGQGFYTFAILNPGSYLMNIRKEQFQTVSVTGITLNVQDNLSRNFVLRVGSSAVSVTVHGDGLVLNTTDASVSTVVDRQFVENIPLNGRSFQDLLTLAPGVVQVPTAATVAGYSGEISVNGQRTEANYFTVDGVSVNTGTAPTNNISGAGLSGSVAGETVLGTTQSLVSIDALQEFRASTSTYSAEYGRTPGGQFSFSTRPGTNTWHGSAYDYFRNDVMDANNWFNNDATPPIPRQAERQNDFGGTLGGPIIVPGLYDGKDKTFFFFSYEGLRLVVPQGSQAFFVPDMTLRQQAPAALRPFLNAFPLPNGGEDGLNDGLAFFNFAYSAPSSLDNVGIRIDHSFGDKLRMFGRYADTPSTAWNYFFPAFKSTQAIHVRSLTVGATSSISGAQSNELRFNITQNNSNNKIQSTSLDGAIPLDISSIPGPNGMPLSPLGTQITFGFFFGGFPFYSVGQNNNEQRQYNLSDTYSWSHSAHQLKLGVDWRRVTTLVNPLTTAESGEFLSEASALANSADFAGNSPFTIIPVKPVYHNYSVWVQDEWRTTQRLSLSLGLRWDINPAPGNLNGPSAYTVDQVSNLTTTKLAPAGTPLWKTDWYGFGPRVGLAYQLRQTPGHETILRTGFGLFYDTGNTQGSGGFQGVGFTSQLFYSGVPFPLTSAQVTLPPPSVAPPYNANVVAFDPNLKLPYTMQWNLAVEQGLGARQSLTIGYVGSAGRRLLTQFEYFPGLLSNPNFTPTGALLLTSNLASSDYDALQVKYQKNLSHGVQALASYTWSHSIDDASSNFQINELLRASSDFDIRNNFQAAITYDVPGSYSNPLESAVLKHWGLDTRISARSALPLDIIGSQTVDPSTGKFLDYHPDYAVPREPLYLYGSQYPGGRVINYNAFTAAPAGVDGNTGRNSARGFDAVQVDLALRRDFPIHDRLHLQFRAEAFNVFNHPSFGSIFNGLFYGPTLFGRAFSTLNNTGSLNSLYANGGPRSLQIALKLQF
jgi:Carboxypeptidase regulatory-like domain